MNAEVTHHVLEKINQEKTPIYFAKKPQIKKSPDELVGLGFRFWMAGYQNNDFEFWKKTWDHFNQTIGTSAARTTVSELASWAQTVQSSALRDIEVSLTEQEQFGRDERMAITMVAAGQHNACPALQACAGALLGAVEVENVVEASTNFGHQLLEKKLLLTDIKKL